MESVKGTKTERNILTAFAGESQARNRYTYFSKQAKKEGFVQIADIFEETANQECEHALRFFKFFNGGELETTWPFPTGVIEDTRANLLSSAELELYVHDTMYKGFADIAREEGFKRAADTFDAIIVAEKHHEDIFRELAANIDSGRVFARTEERTWKCLGCGYLHKGTEAPEKCPACVRKQAYFELLGKNW